MGTLMRHPQLRERHEGALLSGVVITNDSQGVTKNRGSPSLSEKVTSSSYCAPWCHGIHAGKGGPTLFGRRE